MYTKYVTIVTIYNKHWKAKPKVHAESVKLAFLLTTPPWIAVVDHSKPSAKWFERFHQTGFRFDKSIALNRKILNWFRFGLANRLRP